MARAGARVLGALLGLSWVVNDPLALALDVKRSALGLLVTLGAGALLWQGRSLPLPGWRDPRVPLLALAAWLALSVLWGRSAGAAAGAAWLGLAGLTLLVPAFGTSPRLVAVWALNLAGGVTAARVVWAALAGAPQVELHGGAGNPNWAGLVLGPCAWLALSGLWRARRPTLAVGWASLLAWELVASALAASRAAWLGAALALGWWLLGGRRARRSWPAWGLVVGSGLVMLLTGWLAAPEALSGRPWVWRVSAQLALAELPIGVGLGAFPHGFLEAQGGLLRDVSLELAARRQHLVLSAHGEWLDLLASGGPLALLLAWVWLTRALNSLRGWPAGALGLATLVGAMLADSPLTASPAAAGAAALLTVAGSEGAERVTSYSSKKNLPPLASTLLVLVGAWGTWASLGDWLGRRELELASLDPGQRAQHLRRAIRLAPDEPAVVIGWASAALEEPAHVAARLERAIEVNGGTPALYLALGNAERLAARPRAAAGAYQRALRLQPAGLRAHLALGALALEQRDAALAARHLAAARSIYPGDPRLAQLRDQLRRLQLDQAAAGGSD